MEPINTQSGTFDGLGIAPKLLEILDKMGLKSPTPIQQQSIPIAILGKDVMGIAQTGTGKTFAFGIPMLQRIAATKTKGLVILPTRELAVQVNESLQKIGRSLGLKTAVLIGGESMHRQIKALRAQPHVIIATPGRLIDHLEQKTATVAQVGILVLDEADRMLDMGFAPQLRQIEKFLPKERQTMLFSATMEPAIVSIANAYLKMPMRIEVAPAGTTVSNISQEIFFLNKTDKPEMLKGVLNQYKGSVLVFSRTKHGAKKIADVIRRTGHSSSEIHSNRSLSQRLDALEGFKLGKYRVLVATDIAARGIDVKGIELVVNYDLPENAADYVHRIGRTGRAGHTGHAISFATHDQRNDVRSIERLIKKSLPVSPLPKLAAPNPADRPADDRPRRSFDRPRTGDRPARFTKSFDRPKRSFDRPGERPRSNDRSSAPSPRTDRPGSPSRSNDRKPAGRPSYGRPNKGPRKMYYGDQVQTLRKDSSVSRDHDQY